MSNILLGSSKINENNYNSNEPSNFKEMQFYLNEDLLNAIDNSKDDPDFPVINLDINNSLNECESKDNKKN